MSEGTTASLPPAGPGSAASAAPATVAAAAPRPWGFWATMGWSALITVAWIMVGALVLGAFLVVALAADPKLQPLEYIRSTESSGLLLSLSTLPGYGLGMVLLILFARLRGWKVRDYLALEPLKAKETLVTVAVFLAFIATLDTATVLSGRPIVPKFMLEAWRTAGFLPLLLLTLLIAAPVFEEAWFRGFMFRGIAASPVGRVAAVLITAIFWSLLHVQYDWFGIATIFVGGLFLGVVRLKTGSTTLVILLHGIMNLVASVECAIATAGVVPQM